MVIKVFVFHKHQIFPFAFSEIGVVFPSGNIVLGDFKITQLKRNLPLCFVCKGIEGELKLPGIVDSFIES